MRNLFMCCFGPERIFKNIYKEKHMLYRSKIKFSNERQNKEKIRL